MKSGHMFSSMPIWSAGTDQNTKLPIAGYLPLTGSLFLIDYEYSFSF